MYCTNCGNSSPVLSALTAALLPTAHLQHHSSRCMRQAHQPSRAPLRAFSASCLAVLAFTSSTWARSVPASFTSCSAGPTCLPSSALSKASSTLLVTTALSTRRSTTASSSKVPNFFEHDEENPGRHARYGHPPQGFSLNALSCSLSLQGLQSFIRYGHPRCHLSLLDRSWRIGCEINMPC
jgi:hypothetical protein